MATKPKPEPDTETGPIVVAPGAPLEVTVHGAPQVD